MSVLVNTGGSPWLGVPVWLATTGTLHVTSWPNPIVSAATIAFSLPDRAPVSLRVFDAAGRLVSTISTHEMAAGGHELRWALVSDAGRRVEPGVYLVDLRAGARRTTARVTVLR